MKRIQRSSLNRISPVLHPPISSVDSSETVGELTPVPVVIVNVQYGNFRTRYTTSLLLNVPRCDRDVVKVAVTSRDGGAGVVTWRPAGEGSVGWELSIDSHDYERANTDSPLLRTSLAAVRVTVAEANTEVYVSVDDVTNPSRT